ncbi:hypothetical protein P7K49_014941 [Saguinus oedipus]|uniref:Uncharacterized protein n=1 Tax=Saguinus oedipus TaxID=9490 RepID=A0ABQ9VAI9_SAGOE|nr:hypothetical protein P7K49_014941 [Saguinus oedipus]
MTLLPLPALPTAADFDGVRSTGALPFVPCPAPRVTPGDKMRYSEKTVGLHLGKNGRPLYIRCSKFKGSGGKILCLVLHRIKTMQRQVHPHNAHIVFNIADTSFLKMCGSSRGPPLPCPPGIDMLSTYREVVERKLAAEAESLEKEFGVEN